MATLQKRLILVISSLTLVLAVVYFLTGSLIQKHYYETINKLNDNPAIKVSLIDYSKGILHSKANLELQFIGTNPAQNFVLPVQQTITHGPIIGLNILAAKIKTSILYPLAAKPLTFTSSVSFSNQVTTKIKMDAIQEHSASKLEIDSGVLQGEIKSDLNFSNYTLEANMPYLNLSRADTGTDNSLKIQNLNIKLALTKNPEQNIDFDFFTNVADAKIIDRQFKQQDIKLQINNIAPINLLHLPVHKYLSPMAIIDTAQHITASPNTSLTLQLPKEFTTALISYISYEIYLSSALGQFDKRTPAAIASDMNNKVHSIIKMALSKKLFLDQGEYYALNFDRK